MSPTGPLLIDVTGVAEKTAENLSGSGIDSVQALARASVKHIASVPGFGLTRARTVRAAALALLAEQDPGKAEKKPEGKGKKNKGKKNKGKKNKGKKNKGLKKAERSDKKKSKGSKKKKNKVKKKDKGKRKKK